MLHGLRILLLVSIAAVVLLPALAWFAFPWLAPSLARPWLETRGLILEALTVDRPGPGGITVRAIRLHHPSSGLDVAATGMALQWRDPGGLLRGDLTRVDIDTLMVSGTVPEATPDPPSTDPGRLLAALPAARLQVRQLTLNVQLGAHALTAWGDASASRTAGSFRGRASATMLPDEVGLEVALDNDNGLRMAVTTPSGATPWLQLDGRLLPRPGAPDYEGRLKLDLAGLGQWYDTPARWPTGELDLMLHVRPASGPQLQLKPASRGNLILAETTTVRLSPEEDFFVGMDADGRLWSRGALGLAVTWREHHSEGDLRVHLEDFGGEPVRPVASAAARGDIGWPGGGGSVDVMFTATLDQPARELGIAPDARLEFLQLTHHSWRLSGAHLRPTAPIRLGIDPPGLRATTRFAVDIDDPGRLTLDGHVDLAPDTSLELTIHQANLPLTDNDLAEPLLPETWVIRAGRLMADGVVRRTPEGGLSGRLDSGWRQVGVDIAAHRLRGLTGGSALTWNASALQFEALDTRFERAEVSGLPGGPLHLEGGRLTGDGRLVTTDESSWPVPAEAAGRLTVQRAATEAVTVDTLDVHGRLQGDYATAHLRAAAADTGLAMQDLYCEVTHMVSEALRLRECGAALLGGRIQTPEGHLDATTGKGYLPLAITGVDLGAILALLQTPTLTGEGTVDGSLPLTLDDFRPEVEQGWIAARAPGGRIRYRPAAGVLAGIEHPALRTTLRALEDLRYERLATRVDYHRDGALLLAVELYGSNPLIEDGRPIELTLNVEQNLIQLLRSLRFARGLEVQRPRPPVQQ